MTTYLPAYAFNEKQKGNQYFLPAQLNSHVKKLVYLNHNKIYDHPLYNQDYHRKY